MLTTVVVIAGGKRKEKTALPRVGIDGKRERGRLQKLVEGRDGLKIMQVETPQNSVAFRPIGEPTQLT